MTTVVKTCVPNFQFRFPMYTHTYIKEEPDIQNEKPTINIEMEFNVFHM